MLNELRTKKRGFTLLELIVVIVVLGVIAGLAVPTFLSVTTKSREQVAVNEANAFARDVKALAAFTTGADASAWTAEADGETNGSYANGTYTASNGCTVAVTTSGDDVTVGAVSCDGAAAPTTTTTVALSGPATLTLGSFFRFIGPGGSDCTDTTLCDHWTSTHTVLWADGSIYAYFPNSYWNSASNFSNTRYDNGVSPTSGGYCDQQTAPMTKINRYAAGDPAVYTVTASDPCLGF